MDAMTMDYKISPKSVLEKLPPGDDIRATAHAGEVALRNVTVTRCLVTIGGAVSPQAQQVRTAHR